METIKATIVGEPIPVNQTTAANSSTVNVIQDAIGTISNVINDFSDKVTVDPVLPSPEETEAKDKLTQFVDYIKSDNFKDNINQTAKEYGIPPKTLAENFFERALGTIADVLGLAIGTIGNASHALIKLLSTILNSSVNIVVKVANALVGIVTLNKTCQ